MNVKIETQTADAKYNVSETRYAYFKTEMR